MRGLGRWRQLPGGGGEARTYWGAAAVSCEDIRDALRGFARVGVCSAGFCSDEFACAGFCIEGFCS